MFKQTAHKKLPGYYPERQDRHENPLDALWHKYAMYYLSRFASSHLIRSRTLESIAARSKEIKDWDTDAITGEIETVKTALRLKGTRQHEAIRSFALIGEIARRSIGVYPDAEQLRGGWAMLRNTITEMNPGTDTALTAALPACTMAMAGIPTHMITVNEISALTCFNRLNPLYEALGLQVGLIDRDMPPEERQQVYRNNVVYCSARDLVFDFLKDRLYQPQRPGRLSRSVQKLYGPFGRSAHLNLRGLHYAIVDEADNILIDHAHTPLVISGDGNSAFEEEVYQQAVRIARTLHPATDFAVDQMRKQSELTAQGKSKVDEMADAFGGFWNVTRLREMFVLLALTALHGCSKDVDYLVQNGRVQLAESLDKHVTSRGATYKGLLQMIESKEGCTVTTHKDPLAQMTYQKFFTRYHLLAGITATAAEVARELWGVYHLQVTPIPPSKKDLRHDFPQVTFLTDTERRHYLLQRIEELTADGRPILIDTQTLEALESISLELTRRGIYHRKLSTMQEADDASETIREAGQACSITLVTGMSVAKVEIDLGHGVGKRGGLHVIAYGRSNERRIDRQLFGLCGRQGQPGSTEALVSLEDSLFENHAESPLIRMLPLLLGTSRALGNAVAAMAARHIQNGYADKYSRMRKDMLKHDRSMTKLLAFSGQGE